MREVTAELDEARICLTRIGGVIVDAGDVHVPELDQGLEEAVRTILEQRNLARRQLARALAVVDQAQAFMKMFDSIRDFNNSNDFRARVYRLSRALNAFDAGEG